MVGSSEGQATLWRAKIAAARGARDEAVTLFRHAVGEGLSFFSGTFGSAFHADPDLASLRGYEPYKRAVRPDGS